jgi:hypothetical protein
VYQYHGDGVCGQSFESDELAHQVRSPPAAAGTFAWHGCSTERETRALDA